MPVVLDKQDFAKYPFLKEAQDAISANAYSLETLLKDGPRGFLIEKATRRVMQALSSPREGYDSGLDFPEGEVISYALARVIVSCMADRTVIDRLARYEAMRASQFLQNEPAEKRRYVAEQIGFNPDSRTLPVTAYVELTAGLRDLRWRLVNREVSRGKVVLEAEERDDLLRERLRLILARQLPLKIPPNLCERLNPAVERITTAFQEVLMEDFGEVEEESFPPCINALIDAVTKGTNIPHTGRFALTAFLHSIGLSSLQIIEIFTRAPDFDVERTTYQVEHITGSSGTEYTPPSCATMKTYGLCVRRDALCEHVSHPLNYYRTKKKKGKKAPSSDAPQAGTRQQPSQ
jgi:DNA primase large subunit